ncbi:MAG: hypothetical protein E6K79_11910 [Candidatus Eisenbacteria bacterium]|uniref:Uncharacterized protein n=1 Tax=Eiseniibacteriota bacterium TaxID=2212470 RepID=A0A538TGM4_UNCEI|nr:MAG: hypothetical protein E6K79_11910 [Candidatus Eisenbacteria bacterium]
MAKRENGTQYVICISNRGYRASLVVRRIYRMKPDPKAMKHGLLRVVDESGEDYLYPEKLFVTIALPRGAGRAFRAAS